MGTRITSKGQVTIPVEIRQAAKLAEGTELEWSYDPIGRKIVATAEVPAPGAPSPAAISPALGGLAPAE
jgi:AbrB family looped-hinge helix DNA binding protein